MKDPEKKQCPRCEQMFSCSVAEGCWCEKLEISRDVLACLRLTYIDCLCQQCLENLARIGKSKTDEFAGQMVTI